MTQDFTKNTDTKSKVNSRTNNSQKWLTTDRKWNLLFLCIISISSYIAWESISISTALAAILFFTPIIIMLIILKKFSSTKFTTDREFFNSEGVEITTKQIPSNLCFVLPFTATLGTSVLLRMMAFGLQIFVPDGYLILFLVCLFTFCLYFIVKNCPIAILFNRNVWDLMPNPRFVKRSRKDYFTSTAELHRQRMRSPRWRHMPNNPYYRR